MTDDIAAALALLRPLYDSSAGGDGYVSVEVAPNLARDTAGTMDAARVLWDRIDRPNLYVKIPGTAEGVPAIRQMIGRGPQHQRDADLQPRPLRATVMEAYVSGLEDAAAAGLDLSGISSVASFFISRVDTEVDRRLEAVGTDEALALRGTAAVTQGQLAYAMAMDVFSGDRWEALEARGARLQRPLWASTSTKNPAYPDTLYVDDLIGPDTVNTIPDATLEAFDDHGTVARTVDADLDAAQDTWAATRRGWCDLDDVAARARGRGRDVVREELRRAPRGAGHPGRRVPPLTRWPTRPPESCSNSGSSRPTGACSGSPGTAPRRRVRRRSRRGFVFRMHLVRDLNRTSVCVPMGAPAEDLNLAGDADDACSIARSLDIVGDRWTILILRDAFRGLHRFDEFRRDLDIPRAVLADRLRKLVDAGVLVKRRYQDHPPRDEYRLTRMGLELSPILVGAHAVG